MRSLLLFALALSGGLLLPQPSSAGDWQPKSTLSRSMGVAAVSWGGVPGAEIVHKFGINEDIDASTTEPVWAGGTLVYTGHSPTVAEKAEILSSDADDTALGAGARTVRIYGLDANLLEISEVLSLDGVTPVESTYLYLRLFRVKVLTAGATGYNEGILTTRQATTEVNIFSAIPIGLNQSQVAAFTVSADKIGYTLNWSVGLIGEINGTVNAQLRVREPGGVFQVKESISINRNGTNYLQRAYIVPKGPIAPGSDIAIFARASDNNMGVIGAFDLLLVRP